MKTLYLTKGGSNILIDPENKKANKISYQRQSIDSIFVVKEPMHVIYGCGEYEKEVDVEEGDIIVTFYHKVFKNQMVVVNSKDWSENLIEYERKEQEEKELWALKQATQYEPEATDCNTHCENQ